MIAAIISGRVVGVPETKVSAAGKPYVKLLISVPTSQAGSCLVSALCFNSDSEALMALSRGDPVSLAGNAAPHAWVKDGEPQAGLNLMVNGALTLANAKRERKPRGQSSAAKPRREISSEAEDEFTGIAADLNA